MHEKWINKEIKIKKFIENNTLTPNIKLALTYLLRIYKKYKIQIIFADENEANIITSIQSQDKIIPIEKQIDEIYDELEKLTHKINNSTYDNEVIIAHHEYLMNANKGFTELHELVNNELIHILFLVSIKKRKQNTFVPLEKIPEGEGEDDEDDEKDKIIEEGGGGAKTPHQTCSETHQTQKNPSSPLKIHLFSAINKCIFQTI
jgi:hypothetical protein